MVTFRFYRLRFHFKAESGVYFPPGKSGNILRGAFGATFRKIACAPECADPKACELRLSCAYARIFEPAMAGIGPSGLADPPRPFVFRSRHLDGGAFAAGESFHFDVNLFLLRDPAIAYFVLTFAQLGRDGFGPGRGRAALARVDQLDAAGGVATRVFDGRELIGTGALEPTALSLDPAGDRVRRTLVKFRTPTELKVDHKVAERPEFAVLASRLRDRLSTLGDLYGDGPLEMDFAGFGKRAEAVALTRCDLQMVDVDRVSGRTGQRHSLGGFIGTAEYAGELAEFLPFLRAGAFTGVGRQTTWGKGELSVSV